jgi:Zinc carboxypeptidase
MASEAPASSWEFYPGGRYDPSVPAWTDVLGYSPGERITRCGDVARYLAALAERGDRVRRELYGESWEGRELQIAIISAPRHLAALEAIRERIARLAGTRRLAPGPELEAIVRETPPIVWVAANVHGGEHSTAEAALLLAYQLVAGEDETTRAIRERTVVVIDPLQNPDGRERSVNYFYSAFGLRPNPDPNAAEHTTPWPSARPNHYLFDLNRDWIYLTQKETRAKVELYLRWRPQVYADLHEMGRDSSFFFPPPAPPLNVHHPEITRKWWEIYGRAIGSAFDALGFDYYVGESFDSFFPGYGEAWPSLHGAVGMTFEQASVHGLSVRRKDETTLLFREAIQHHFIACMAVCRTAAERAEECLRDFYEFHRTAVEEGRAGPVREYLIPPGDRAADVASLADTLTRQGIEVAIAEEPFTHPGAHPLRESEPCERPFPAGTAVVRLDQPAGRLARTLFEPEATLEEAFLREELERKEKRLPDRFYDVTAWSVADSTGLEVYAGAAFSEVRARAWADAARPSAAPLPETAVAYLLPYTATAAAYALAELLEAGIRVHVAGRPFRSGGRSFGRGTLVLRRRGNPEDLPARLDRLAAQRGITVLAAESSWTEEGISLGSDAVAYLKRPRIAALYDHPAASTSYGWLAYLLEQRAPIGFTPIRHRVLASEDLADYNVIVLPDGSDYARFLDEPVLRRLREWVSMGGVLVALRGAAACLARPPASPDLRFTTVRRVTDLRELRHTPGEGESTAEAQRTPRKDEEGGGKGTSPESASSPRPMPPDGEKPTGGTPAEEVPPEFRPDRVPGAVLKARLDPHHPLCYGYGETLNVLAASDHLFTPSLQGWNAATFAEEGELRVSGFLWEKMRAALAGKPYLVDEPLGRGHVILFAEDPNFRAAWESLSRLFLNALLFMPSLQR